MATNYPSSLDNFTNPTGSNTLASPSHASQHADINDAVEALEAKVGVNGSDIATSHTYKIGILEANSIAKTLVDAKGDLLVGTADNTVARLAVGGTNGHVLMVDSAQTAGVKWAAVSVTAEDDQIVLAQQVFG